MAPFNSYLYLNNDHNGLPEDGMDSAADIFPTIEESSFCSNFQCCGRSLKDLHELLQHYEESHVRIEDGEDDAIAAGMFDFDTVLAADSLLNVGADASNRANSSKMNSGAPNVSAGVLTPTPNSVSSIEFDRSKRQSPNSKRPRILTLGIEPCDYANDDSEHLSAFDNTVIRPVDPYRVYNSYNGHHGYARIAPKRSHSVPALPNFPLINGESGFKLIHSILSSTADPPSSDNSDFQSGISSQMTAANLPTSVPSGYPNGSYSLSRSGNDRPFVCPVSGCGKTYKNANGLKYHAIHGHDGVLVEKPHKCPFNGCGKRYKNSNGLKYHFQHAHPNTPPPSGLTMTSVTSGPGNYPSHSSAYSRPQGFAVPYSSSVPAAPQIPPPRPHSTVPNHATAPAFNRMTPSATPNPSPAVSPVVPTSSQTGTTTTPTLSPETVQNLLATAPAAIANLLKKNPNLKQHLPTIIRNLQQIALQKSSNTSTQNTDQEKKPSIINSSEMSNLDRQQNIPKSN